jgi:hypothetical protein
VKQGAEVHFAAYIRGTEFLSRAMYPGIEIHWAPCAESHHESFSDEARYFLYIYHSWDYNVDSQLVVMI